MTKDDIIDLVGREAYDDASAILRRVQRGPDPMLPHDVSPAIWDAPLPGVEKVALFFEVYDDLPGYAMLMYATGEHPGLDAAARDAWWRACLARIGGGDDVLREPILYSMWCDFFEDPVLVGEAWSRLTSPGDRRVTAAVLPASGPVPWALKAPVYEQAAAHPFFHAALFQGLLGSAVDVFGSIEVEPARRLLARLDVPQDARGLAELSARLGL